MTLGPLGLPEKLETSIRVEPTCGCWIWVGGRTSCGYGMTSRGKIAHRVVYEHLRGKIPDGLEIDHRCRLRACVNPWHLEPVTRLENARRVARHGKSCKQDIDFLCTCGKCEPTPEEEAALDDSITVERFGSLTGAVNAYKRAVMLDSLRRCGWNKTHAARALGIDRNYFGKLMRRYSIRKYDLA